MDNDARLLRYLCFGCGSQGIQMRSADGSYEPICPKCGGPVTTELDLKPAVSADES